MGYVITILALVSIFATCLYLVFNRKYEDGIVGRGALAGLALAATVYLLGIISGVHLMTGPEELMLWSVAVFLLRHAYRFHRYMTTGRGAWGKLGELDRGWSEAGSHQTR